MPVLLIFSLYIYSYKTEWFVRSPRAWTYTEQQKKRIFCIIGIVYKLGFKYWSNDLQGVNNAWNMCIAKCITNG